MLKNNVKKIGRPKKCRCVGQKPKVRCFVPYGLGLGISKEIVLDIDECEALCLADRQGMYQADAAKKMKISRQTFGNIIESARKKVSEAVLCGRVLRIGEGHHNISLKSKKKGSAVYDKGKSY